MASKKKSAEPKEVLEVKDASELKEEARLAVLIGNEGNGLTDETCENADYKVIIPMSHEVDSLNAAAASAVAFWELAGR